MIRAILRHPITIDVRYLSRWSEDEGIGAVRG